MFVRLSDTSLIIWNILEPSTLQKHNHINHRITGTNCPCMVSTGLIIRTWRWNSVADDFCTRPEDVFPSKLNMKQLHDSLSSRTEILKPIQWVHKGVLLTIRPGIIAEITWKQPNIGWSMKVSAPNCLWISSMSGGYHREKQHEHIKCQETIKLV